MASMKIVRFVRWPRDEVLSIEGDNWSPTQFGVMIQATDKTKVLIPWANVIDITETTLDALTVIEKPKLVKPRK